MSLNFELTRIDNWQELWEPATREDMQTDMVSSFREDDDGTITRLNPVTQALIFRTMAVGLGSIGPTNMSDFYARCVIFERTFNSFLIWQDGEKVGTKPEHIHRHLGLSTNVANETWVKWRNRTMDNIRGETAYDFKKWYGDHLAGLAAVSK